jgi:hypothetical protein
MEFLRGQQASQVSSANGAVQGAHTRGLQRPHHIICTQAVTEATTAAECSGMRLTAKSTRETDA